MPEADQTRLNSDNAIDDHALRGAITPTFFKYLFPSLLGLLAFTSATIVDGIFIGNYIGVTALAAVNLIFPVTTLLFGVALMLIIGGSMRGGRYLGEGNSAKASAIFSKTSLAVAGYGVVVVLLGLAFEEIIFAGLGATKVLFPVMSEYYRVIIPFLVAQFFLAVLYYFVRLDGFPGLAAAALAIGALGNVALNYIFIAILDWGLTGAATRLYEWCE